VAKTKTKPKAPPSSRLRGQLRTRIQHRIDELNITRAEAAHFMGLSIAQTSRLCNDYDAFSLDRLVDAAEGVGLTVEMKAVRPYSKE
jgi:predicted XRE-type DNA-binding protein